jgi:eukaryotic-like serine/threonine-protein kinase
LNLVADRYELAEPLGSGGMARVVAAHDRVLDRRVAVKFIHDERAGNPVDRQRLLREARGAAALHHPNTVAVFDAGEDDGRPFIVMELVTGTSLAERLQRSGALPVDETVAVVAGVLAGLAAAHGRGLVHRDVKPANILLPDEGGVKLADFGIAKALAEASVRLTDTGHVLGTPRYLAPEQAAGQPATPRSDLYSLGVVAYECLAGRAPFEADSALAVALAHQQAPVPSLAAAAPRVPPALVAAVERTLEKDPEARYASAAEMRRAVLDAAGAVPMGAAATRLLETTEELVSEPVAPPSAGGARRWGPLAAGLGALLAIGVVATLLLVADPAGDGAGAPEPDPREPAGPEEPADPEGIAGSQDEPGAPGADEPGRDAAGPGAAADLDELLRLLAPDPAEFGEKGGDLADALREVRNLGDGAERAQDARELIEDVAGWMAAGELAPAVGRRAVELLEPVGRPADPALAAASTLYAEIAGDKRAWGEPADDLLGDLLDLLDAEDPADYGGKATDLSAEVEEWRADGELDGQQADRVLAVLRPLHGDG